MTLVMLYRTTVKPEAIEQLNEIRSEFSDIYTKLGIEVIGHWKNAESPNESVYMVKYESESDFQHKTRALQEDENYIRLTAQLNSLRTDFTPEKLVPA
jgi:lipopolysaccharide biosynthesis protein